MRTPHRLQAVVFLLYTCLRSDRHIALKRWGLMAVLIRSVAYSFRVSPCLLGLMANWHPLETRYYIQDRLVSWISWVDPANF
jgi:hypothetical protein